MKLPLHLVECICGHASPYGWRFCSHCGASMSSVERMRNFWNHVADRARGNVPDGVKPKGE